jgi:hypothetical protein
MRRFGDRLRFTRALNATSLLTLKDCATQLNKLALSDRRQAINGRYKVANAADHWWQVRFQREVQGGFADIVVVELRLSERGGQTHISGQLSNGVVGMAGMIAFMLFAALLLVLALLGLREAIGVVLFFSFMMLFPLHDIWQLFADRRRVLAVLNEALDTELKPHPRNAPATQKPTPKHPKRDLHQKATPATVQTDDDNVLDEVLNAKHKQSDQ